MTTKGLISEKYDHFLLQAQWKKVKRLVLTPLVGRLSEFKQEVDREKLAGAVGIYIGAVESLETNDIWFEGFEAVVDELVNRLPERSKGSPSLFQEPKDASIAWDPRFSENAYLHYAMGQFVQKALINGLMVCVAQNGPQFSLIAAEEFSHGEDDVGYPLPAALDPFPIEKFTRLWCEELAADRLWFALSYELESDLQDLLLADSLRSEKKTNKSQSNGSRRGFGVEDEPFVELAMELLKSNCAKNPHVAMGMVEDGLWKRIKPEEKSFEAAVAGKATYESKKTRLYTKLKLRWHARSNDV